MKWLFLMMVAVNIAIFVWGLQRDTGTSAALDPRYRNIGEIKLLTKSDIASQSATQIPVKYNAGELSSGTEQKLTSEESVSATSLDTPVEDTDPELELSAERKDDEDVSAVSLDAYSQSAEIGIPPAVLSAVETIEPSQTQTEELETTEAEKIAAPEIFCWTLGPIDKRLSALTILEAVEKKVASAGLREEIEKDVTGFWVVLPPYENASAAIAVVNQLKSRDISDVQRFYRGELQNGVSLGVYNRRFNAEKRKSQIETKGFSPEVLPRYKEKPQYWVDYRREKEVDVQVDLPFGYRDLTTRQRECTPSLN